MKFRNFVGVFLASFIRLSQFGKHFTDYVESENQFVQFQLTKNKPVNGSGTSKGGPPPPMFSRVDFQIRQNPMQNCCVVRVS